MSDIASILEKNTIKDLYMKMGMQKEEKNEAKYNFDKYNSVSEFNLSNDQITGWYECKVEFGDVENFPINENLSSAKFDKLQKSVVRVLKSEFEFLTGSCLIEFKDSCLCNIYFDKKIEVDECDEKKICERCYLFGNSKKLQKNKNKLRITRFLIDENEVKFKIYFRRVDKLSLRKLLYLLILNKKRNSFHILNRELLFRIYVTGIYIRDITIGNKIVSYEIVDKKREFKQLLSKDIFEKDFEKDIVNDFLEFSTLSNIKKYINQETT